MSYASKRRKSSSDDEGGGANWMDTYGDLVTLLLCFFVLLFAFSSTDASKWEALVAAFSGSPMISRQSLDMTATIINPIPLLPQTEEEGTEISSGSPDIPEEFENAEDAFFELYERMESFVQANGIMATINADFDSLVLILRFDDSIFFRSGEAILLPEAVEILDLMAVFFEENYELYQMIVVEGHTDTVPISGRYENNMELSMYRAYNTWKYFVYTGEIDRSKIISTGYGEDHPIATNDTEEGKAQNRRVDFVIQGILG